jgi:hypothetical protein
VADKLTREEHLQLLLLQERARHAADNCAAYEAVLLERHGAFTGVRDDGTIVRAPQALPSAEPQALPSAESAEG